jgi:hypothetical protein
LVNVDKRCKAYEKESRNQSKSIYEDEQFAGITRMRR